MSALPGFVASGRVRGVLLGTSLLLLATAPRSAWGQCSGGNWNFGSAITETCGSVGIGTTNPGSQLEIATQASSATRGLTVSQYTSDASAAVDIYRKARGTLATPTVVVNTDYIGASQYEAFDGSQFLAGLAGFGGRVNGTVATGSVPTDLFFFTSGGSADNDPYKNNHVRMVVSSTGNVGIGTTDPANKLSVAGTVQAYEVLVNTGWSDYVFNPDYRLAPLTEVANYIEQNHHLPGIPSAKEVQEKGVSLGDMQAKMLAKIEELTLHMIHIEERDNRLEQENRDLQQQNQGIQARISELEAGLPH